MQFFSLGVMAPGPDDPHTYQLARDRMVEFTQRDDLQWLWHFTIAMLIGSILLCVVWCWIASKIVVRGEHATIRNAFKVWLANLLLPIGVCAGLVFFGPLVIDNLRGIGPAVALAVVGGFLLLCLLLWIQIPMRVYEIDFLSAVGLVLLTIAMAVAGMFAAANIFHANERSEAFKNATGKTEAERAAFSERLRGKDAPDEIDRLLDDVMIPIGKPKPLPEREASAKIIQQKLEARRRALPPGDTKALADFQPRLDRYLRLLNDLKAERAAQTQGAVAH